MVRPTLATTIRQTLNAIESEALTLLSRTF